MKIIEHPEMVFVGMKYVSKNEKRYIVTHHPEAIKYSPRQIHAQHTAQKWGGAGYHFYIRKDGSVHRLRPTLAVGAHCPKKNKDGIGVSWEGNWHVEKEMSKVQFEAGVELYRYLMKEYNIPIDRIGKHGDFRATNCPGKYFPWANLLQRLKGQKAEEPVQKTKSLTLIQGQTGITREQAIIHINAVNNDCKINCKLSELIDYYFLHCAAYNIRAEIAIAQMLLETSYLRFGGIVQPHQNNFAGIGALDGNKEGNAASFKSVSEGVLAQIQHLYAYSSVGAVPGREIVDPRFGLVQRGSAPYVEYLSIPRNPAGTGWASDKYYAEKIKNITHKIDAVKVQREHWGAGYVKKLQERGLISEFHNPDEKISWAELGVILERLK